MNWQGAANIRKGLHYFLWVSLLASCTLFSQKIGMKDHKLKRRPKKIIWLQVSGYSTEHTLFHKYLDSGVDVRTVLESPICVGRAWNYTLYEMKPDIMTANFMQISGSRNILNSCSDLRFVWQDLESQAFTSAVYVVREDFIKNRPFSVNNCFQPQNENLILIKTETRKRRKESNTLFHFQETKAYGPQNIYYDKACDEKECYSPLSKNVISLFQNIFKNKERFLFNIQDYSYWGYLQAGKFDKAYEVLSEINQIVEHFVRLNDSDLLFILSGVAPQSLVFPKKVSSGGNLFNNISKSKDRSLEDVLAFGPSAENFCGIYHSSEIKHRINWSYP